MATSRPSPRCCRGGDLFQMCQSRVAHLAECRSDALRVDPLARGPHGEHERYSHRRDTTPHPGPTRPGTRSRGAWMARSPISSTASASASSSPSPIGRGSQGRGQAEPLAQQNLDQCHARTRAFVQRQRADLIDRHATEQLHAQHRPAAGDAGVGNDRVLACSESTRSTGPAPRPDRPAPADRPSGWASPRSAPRPAPTASNR